MIHRHRPLLAHWEWQSSAQCRGMDSSVFFSPPGERGPARRAREDRARAVCAGCAVRDTCALTAMRGGEEYGVWGGLTEQDRVALSRRRNYAL